MVSRALAHAEVEVQTLNRVACAWALSGLLGACGLGALLSVSACGKATVTQQPDADQDGGDASVDAASAGDATPEAEAGAAPGTLDASLDGAQANTLPARVCALRVGAECDGSEDCPDGQTCCATFDGTSFAYSSIACRSTCDPPSGFRLCHPGDTCEDPRHVCRRSRIAIHDFILVCYEPTDVPEHTRGRTIAGEVVCGSTTCEVGQEKCCLRAWFHIADVTATPLEPYCAPLDAACDCEDDALPVRRPDASQDAGQDASQDASQDAGQDAGQDGDDRDGG